MKKILLALSILSSTPFSSFAYEEVPNHCVPGRWLDSSNSYGLKIESVNDFYLYGVTDRIKGDYHDWVDNWYKDVHFYNNFEGYVGTKSTGMESDAYINMTFNARGKWVIWGFGESSNYTGTECAKAEAYVQNAPTIKFKGLSGGGASPIIADVYGTIDQEYSKNALQGIGRQYIFRFRNASYGGGTYTLTQSSGVATQTPTYNGDYVITAKVFDGTFYSNTITLGTITYTGGREPIVDPGCQMSCD